MFSSINSGHSKILKSCPKSSNLHIHVQLTFLTELWLKVHVNLFIKKDEKKKLDKGTNLNIFSRC